MQITQNYCGLHNAIMQQQQKQQQLNAAYLQLATTATASSDKGQTEGWTVRKRGIGRQTVGQSIVYYFKLAAQICGIAQK